MNELLPPNFHNNENAVTSSIPYAILDVFTKTPLRGNSLAVFPEPDGLTEPQMQAIAGEMNLSETVFVLPPTHGRDAARLRIFTPRRELPFAGHPTIGAARWLADNRELGDAFSIEEQIGRIAIRCDRDAEGERVFWLTTPKLAFYEAFDFTQSPRPFTPFQTNVRASTFVHDGPSNRPPDDD